MYKVVFRQSVSRTLKKVDAQTKVMIMSWIKRNLHDCGNLRASGKALSGEFKGLWRYRVGNYRIVAHIVDNEVKIITIIDVAHRKEIYK